MKKHHREFMKAARKLGITEVRVVPGGKKHRRLVGKYGSRFISLTLSTTEACGVARKVGDMKRAMHGQR